MERTVQEEYSITIKNSFSSFKWDMNITRADMFLLKVNSFTRRLKRYSLKDANYVSLTIFNLIEEYLVKAESHYADSEQLLKSFSLILESITGFIVENGTDISPGFKHKAIQKLKYDYVELQSPETLRDMATMGLKNIMQKSSDVSLINRDVESIAIIIDRLIKEL